MSHFGVENCRIRSTTAPKGDIKNHQLGAPDELYITERLCDKYRTAPKGANQFNQLMVDE